MLKGKPRSPEIGAKNKFSQRKRGNREVFSQRSSAKISAAKKGKPRSPEIGAKIGESLRGKSLLLPRRDLKLVPRKRANHTNRILPKLAFE